MGDAFERVGYNQLNHKLKITGGGFEVSSGNISGSTSSTGSFGYISIGGTALPETIADTDTNETLSENKELPSTNQSEEDKEITE